MKWHIVVVAALAALALAGCAGTRLGVGAITYERDGVSVGQVPAPSPVPPTVAVPPARLGS